MIAYAAVGCGNPKPAPEVASSAHAAGYAVAYPAELKLIAERYSTESEEARNLSSAFSTYPNALADPDWTQVLAIYERADETGRGHAYAAAVDDSDRVRVFFEEEKEDINRRLTGTVKSAMEKSECTCEIEAYGKLSYALKDSVNRQLDKRVFASSEAHLLIERYAAPLGKKNTEVLEKQALEIAQTSHTVAIHLPTLWLEMDRRVSEERKVLRTLENAIEAEEAFVAHSETDKKAKKTAEERLTELKAARDAVKPATEAARELLKKQGDDIKALKDEYEAAFDALCGIVDEKISAAQ